MKKHKKIDLLAPAGNFEKLEIAIHYGADAVYLGGKNFSLRNFSGNFELDEMKRAVDFAHDHGAKVYVTCNVFPRNDDLDGISDFLASLNEIKPDGVIIADPGVFSMARENAPDIPIHISVQANNTSAESARFWGKMGAVRINTARELSLAEISEIAAGTGIEIESFAHGAMCVSYSGRCLLSSFLSNRDANQGKCSHPCRWKYSVMEHQRPGQYLPVAEDDRGTYIFNSKDLCMIEHIPEMIHAGIDCLKIEGRMKGINYLASTVRVYRAAIDRYYDDPDRWEPDPRWKEELSGISNRDYCAGFYFGDPSQTTLNRKQSKSDTDRIFIGKVLGPADHGMTSVEVRNKLLINDAVEILAQQGPVEQDVIKEIINENGERLDVAQHGARVTILFEKTYAKNDIIRKINS